jgi:hypothetical protein
MSTEQAMSASLDYQHRAELEAVIASGIFAKAPSLALLLDYICTKFFEGQANQIKEYNIAVEALSRPPSFDPRQDSIVRVEAFRLRKRLKQYYEGQGADRPLRIVIPSGQYIPQFVENVRTPSNGHGDATDTSTDAAAELALATPGRELAVTPAGLTLPLAMPVRSRSWIKLAALLALPLLVAILVVWIWSSRVHSPVEVATRPLPVPMGADSEEIRILCGSATERFVDRAGNVWRGDRFFRGGSVFTSNHAISRTPDPELFRFRREGDFSYDIPLKPGVYELHLFFAETLFGDNNTAGGGESSRVFRVSINGKPNMFAFDVTSDAGGSNTADEKVFKDILPGSDGMLHVQFSGLVNNVPFLNALELVPGIPGKMRPVRIVARARSFTDQRGQIWGEDRYFSHGFSVPRSEPVSDTVDPEVFQAERFGNFSYVIPVAAGRYKVTLRFAETWFGPGKPGAGGADSRIFDVYCNGLALLRNFDIFRTAGGPQRALDRTFRGITPNAQGKIELAFVPVVNYACINAIEVVDDSN